MDNPFVPPKRQKDPYILSVSERENLIQEKKELEATIRDAESGEYGQGTRASVDKVTLKRQVDQIDTALHQNRARNLSSSDKDKVSNMAKQLENEIKDGMPTYDEMHAPDKHPGAVRKQYEWEKKNAHKIERWKYLRRQLEPNDPTVSNVEQLRRGR
jgi:hypothetical protein